MGQGAYPHLVVKYMPNPTESGLFMWTIPLIPLHLPRTRVTLTLETGVLRPQIKQS